MRIDSCTEQHFFGYYHDLNKKKRLALERQLSEEHAGGEKTSLQRHCDNCNDTIREMVIVGKEVRPAPFSRAHPSVVTP